jgi:nucleotide-binding universal stress UspA family protein
MMGSSPLRRVVVALDGSPLAESALRVGFGIAQRVGGAVTLLHARPYHLVDGVDEASLRAVAERFADVAPFDVELHDGDAAGVLLAASADVDALLCMASHGRGGVSRLVFGSVAEEVVRCSRRPVVVVGPSAASFPLLAERATVLACTDGSEAATRSFEHTVWLADGLDLHVVVAEVVGPDEEVAFDDDTASDRVVAMAHLHCERLTDQLHSAGPGEAGRESGRCTVEVLRGDPVRTITERAAALPASFVAVATHGRTGLSRYTIGSTAGRLVRDSPCPILLSGPATRDADA